MSTRLREVHTYIVLETSPLFDVIYHKHQRVRETEKNISFKALTNDDEDEESENEDLDANICFMAFEEDGDEVNSHSNYNEFQDAFQELYFDLENLGLKNVSLKKKIYSLQNELKELKEKFKNIEKTKTSFERENEELKKKK